ncbi:contact-dependent growth inhibition system immunity protein [Streptomyces spinosirectus]
MTQEPPSQGRFYELAELLNAYTYTDLSFSDTPETPGPGLASYLRTAARDPARAETAVQQIEDLLSVGLFSDEIADDVDDLPHINPPLGKSVEDCLRVVRDHLYRFLQDPARVPQMNPQTRWEWDERFPELGQLLGGYFHQNFPDFYGSRDEALDEYIAELPREDREKTAQEIKELLDIAQSEQELDTATSALGLGLLPPDGMTLRQWLEFVRQRISPA